MNQLLKEDQETIVNIAKRLEHNSKHRGERTHARRHIITTMITVHCKVITLDLHSLLKSKEREFIKDMNGILDNFNFMDNTLVNGFTPKHVKSLEVVFSNFEPTDD